MSDDIYSASYYPLKINNELICQFVDCRLPLKLSNKKFCNLTCCNKEHARKQKIRANEARMIKEKEYASSPIYCKECNSPIAYKTIKQGPAKFCNHSCAAKYSNKMRSSESRKLQGQKLSKNTKLSRIKLHEPTYPYTTLKWHICEYTGKPYHNRSPTGKGRRQVSPYVKDIKQIYYQLSKFKFNVYKMPQLFDINLLEQHGWYSCPGKKRRSSAKNLDGISRDHRYSISAGFANKIHPLILSHPANCMLVQHKDNKIKECDCEISIEELVEQIKIFDNKIHNYYYHELILKIVQNNLIYLDNLEILRKLI